MKTSGNFSWDKVSCLAMNITRLEKQARVLKRELFKGFDEFLWENARIA